MDKTFVLFALFKQNLGKSKYGQWLGVWNDTRQKVKFCVTIVSPSEADIYLPDQSAATAKLIVLDSTA